jgi:hypothetical protein
VSGIGDVTHNGPLFVPAAGAAEAAMHQAQRLGFQRWLESIAASKLSVACTATAARVERPLSRQPNA